jgi:hypothetical protein
MTPGFGRQSSVDSGTLDFTFEPGFTPSLGEQFAVMGVGAPFPDPYQGTFATINTPELPSGETWDLSQLYNAGVISVIVPEPAITAILLFSLSGLAMRRHGRSRVSAT